jgi:hypothetical protein
LLQFSLFCIEQKLMTGELVAIDGSKFAGVNHKGRNFNADRLAQRLAALDEGRRAGRVGASPPMVNGNREMVGCTHPTALAQTT